MKRYWNVHHVPELAGLSPQEQDYLLAQFRPLSFISQCRPFRLVVMMGIISNITVTLIVTNLHLLADKDWLQILLMFVAMVTYVFLLSQVYIQHVRPHLAEARARLSDRRATTSET